MGGGGGPSPRSLAGPRRTFSAGRRDDTVEVGGLGRLAQLVKGLALQGRGWGVGSRIANQAGQNREVLR